MGQPLHSNEPPGLAFATTRPGITLWCAQLECQGQTIHRWGSWRILKVRSSRLRGVHGRLREIDLLLGCSPQVATVKTSFPLRTSV